MTTVAKRSNPPINILMSTSDVMAYLHTNRVVNTLDCEEIRIVEHNHGRAEAAAELLFMLPRRDRNWYGKFIEALIACQQTDLAALIDKDLVESKYEITYFIAL